ncbi:MAG: PHP domain-containing protein [Ruminococcaceae bacterium]|nr:PHP domain-containing protein [Oscillospiraceae bacterium]
MDFKNILKDYSYTTELHAHTNPASFCGDFPANEVVDFYRAAGVTTLAITNHFNSNLTVGNLKENVKKYLEDYHLAKDCAKEDVNVILGIEIRFDGSNNDYLVFGIDEADLPFYAELTPYGIENFYKQVKNERNVIIQAHPFRNGVTLAPIDSIDGIEAYNLHPNHNQRNALSTQHAKKNNLLVTGGSDFHHVTHHALCLMRTKHELKNSFDVASAIKSKDVIFDASGSIIIPYIY